MPQPNLEAQVIGPCLVFYGDPYKNPASVTQTEANAAMQYLGPTSGDVVIQPQLTVALINADQAGGAIDAYGSWNGFVAQVPFTDEQKIRLASYWPGTVPDVTDPAAVKSIGFKPGTFRIDTKVLALIPQDEAALGLDAPHAWWFVNALCDQVGQFTFKKVTTGQAGENPRATQFTNLKKSVLGVKPTVTVPENARAGLYGSPKGFFPSGETNLWTLPAMASLRQY